MQKGMRECVVVKRRKHIKAQVFGVHSRRQWAVLNQLVLYTRSTSKIYYSQQMRLHESKDTTWEFKWQAFDMITFCDCPAGGVPVFPSRTCLASQWLGRFMVCWLPPLLMLFVIQVNSSWCVEADPRFVLQAVWFFLYYFCLCFFFFKPWAWKMMLHLDHTDVYHLFVYWNQDIETCWRTHYLHDLPKCFFSSLSAEEDEMTH